ncbi:MAG TPA: hypothetical protein VJZ71_14045 [Phycisphaerae bacterium]|nr:hypothetical protein [Phycisphaerae bacterium]
MTDTVIETIALKCICGTNMRVRAAAAGKRAKCPTCGAIQTIPGSAAAPMPNPAMSVQSPRDLSDLVPLEPPPGAAIGEARCADAPETMATVVTSLGTFALGTVLSGVGAAIGGVVWFLVVYYANFEVGYIAWGIGVLAGLGMVFGHKAHTTRAGVTAAGMAALGIIGAKVAIFFCLYTAFLNSITPADDSGINEQREFVTGMTAEKILDARGITADEKREAQWDSVYEEATERVQKMDDDEVREKCRTYGDDLRASMGGKESMTAAFVESQFTAFDLLWFFLAIGSAFKIGRGATVKET